jgi:predicted nucleic acid-binding protein
VTPERPWVLDCSVTMAWCFEDEKTQATDELLGREEPVLVSQIWPLEVGNVLMLAMQKGRINSSRQKQFVALLQRLPITLDVFAVDGAFEAVLFLAQAHRLTMYDASYLELAIRTDASLATRDAHLARAAKRAGVPLLPV